MPSDLARRRPASVVDATEPGIAGLAPRYRELGRLRMGERLDTGRTKNGKPVKRPAKLETWRFTSTDWRLIQCAAQLYGGEPSRWDDAPGWNADKETGVRQFQVTTEANDVPVMLPPEVALSQAMEAWTAAECLRRCDGQFDEISGAECLCKDEQDDGEAALCKPTTRLSVLLADMPGLGVWRLETHGWYAARELVPMVRMAATFGAGQRFRLRIDPRQRQTTDAAGKHVTYLFGVPVLDTDLTPGELLAATPAPEPVVEVARMVEQTSGEVVGSVAPASTAGPPSSRATSPDDPSGGDPVEHPRRTVDPPPDPTSGSKTAGTSSVVDPDPTSPPSDGSVIVGAGQSPASSRAQAGAPTSDPGTSAPPGPGSDPKPLDPAFWVPGLTSPPVRPGDVSPGGDPVPLTTDERQGEAIPDDDNAGVGSDSSGDDTPRTSDGVGQEQVVSDETADPTPSLVQLWCDEHDINIRLARVVLRKAHDEFADLLDWKDLQELEGERAAQAVRYLDVWLHTATEGGT